MAMRPTYDWRTTLGAKPVYDFRTAMQPTTAQSVGPVIAKSDPRVQPYVTPPIPTQGLTQEQQAWLQQRFEVPLPVASMLMLGDLLPATTAISSMPGFYSRLERAMATLPAKAHPSKVLSVAKNAASGEEIAWRGLDQFLAGKGNAPVGKEEVLGWLAEHPLDVQPVVKKSGGMSPQLHKWFINHGSGVPETAEEWQKLAARFEATAKRVEAQGPGRPEVGAWWSLAEEAQQIAEGVNPLTGSTAGMPKFQQYTLPGGKDYRETLLTLSTPQRELQRLIVERNQIDKAIARSHAVAGEDRFAPHPPELVARYNEVQGKIDALSSGQFKSAHWTEPNVLVHARANERTLPGAGKGRFLEEVQSDWHQQGKKKGYQGTAQAQAADAAAARAREAYQQLRQAAEESQNPSLVHEVDRIGRMALTEAIDHPTAIMLRERHGVTDPRVWQAIERHRAATDQLIRANRVEQGAVPNAPFKESWPDLALKQQLLDVANRPDLDWIGFTSGETQAARYDLSKQVDAIRLSGDFDQAIEVSVAKPGEGFEHLTTTTKGKLADVVGKEIAEKALQGGQTEFRGVDLMVGGEGMRKFYDDLLVKRMEKLVKPFGGTVERAPLSGSKMTVGELDQYMDDLHRQLEQGDITEAVFRARLNRAQAERNRAAGFTGAPKGTEAWIVRLTPEMKAKIKAAGLPLLSGLPFLSQMPSATIAPSTLKQLQERR